jgi:hypothetical protein
MARLQMDTTLGVPGYGRSSLDLGQHWAICDNRETCETSETARTTRIEFSRLSFLSPLMAVSRRWLILLHLADIKQRLRFNRTVRRNVLDLATE